ncbi:MAG: signal peptidase endoplasmic reticulum-type [Fusobacteria bacterium]|nr:MAG: signal peptidase endoplasmic reticulum-type [Fusobacteriota bacterium]KAF0228860.1 MAG: signal peptidase endoplasmic [Fusobacteriota bacterium]
MKEEIFKIVKYTVLLCILIYSLIILSIFILPLVKFYPLSVNDNDMSPSYSVGSLVLLNEIDVTKIYPDDVIAFTTSDKKYSYDISRIVNKNIVKRIFEIRGDNINVDSAKEITYVSILGKVVYDIPYLGYINNFISETKGKIISSTIILGLLVIPYLIKFLLDD